MVQIPLWQMILHRPVDAGLGKEGGVVAQRLRQSEEGFALVAVIWLAGLIAAISAGFALVARVHVLEAAAANRSLEAALAADGLARLAAFRLAADPAGTGIDRDGRAIVCRWGERIVAEVSVQNHGGLVDLNAAPVNVLRRLFAGLDEGPVRAQALADAVADYRDRDEDAAAGGREPQSYDGRNFGPKNAPFQAIEELDQIPGMEEPLYRKLKPFVTVHSLQPGFDPALMPPGLKAALGFGADGQPPPEIAGFANQGQSQVFGIDVSAVFASGARYRRQAIVSLTRQPGRPFALLAWQQGGSFDALAGERAPPCF
jgi:general secretion pathway protein K